MNGYFAYTVAMAVMLALAVVVMAVMLFVLDRRNGEIAKLRSIVRDLLDDGDDLNDLDGLDKSDDQEFVINVPMSAEEAAYKLLGSTAAGAKEREFRGDEEKVTKNSPMKIFVSPQGITGPSQNRDAKRHKHEKRSGNGKG